MKIAVPTDDLITVSESLVGANWLKIFEFKSELVTSESVFKNPGIESMGGSLSKYYMKLGNILNGCDALIIHENDPAESDIIEKSVINAVRSRERFITNAAVGENALIVNYESNRCCSP